ncbi:protein regulator of cytokinesis 1-like [Phlebotomus argentipes]|uniref:protein regulator of cytokinesis 1-like n=1 Tax=Phlebotomus argentipes TaxID=94469 RepID=UPI002892E3B9|nr:protein regulator of cytokinesis 1-like [Phlebotomus argentipes]
MAHLEKLQEKIEGNIGEITRKSLNILRSLWAEQYETKLCEDNIAVIVEHVQSFFDEIIEEARKKRTVILTDIENLQKEASNIRRLLHVDFQLSPAKDTPLHSLRAYLDESLRNLREQLRGRKDEIYELLMQQEELCEELGEECRELVDDPLPTAEDLLRFREYLKSLSDLKESRIAEVIKMRRDIKMNLVALEITLMTDADNALVNGPFLLTKDGITQLRDMQQHFAELGRELKTSIESIHKKLTILWDYLEVGDETRQSFEIYTEISQTTHDRLKDELIRCELAKKQNIKKIVDKIRDEIRFWWTKTLKSDLEMSRFTNFTSELYTEDLLTLHEMELEELKFHYNSNERIFELISERKTLWDRMLALEKSASNPNRFNNRGGQLLREEKERKTIASKLPKIEAQLTELVQAYEGTNHRKFTMHGEVVEDVIASDWEKRKLDKEKVMSARKMIKSTTPTPFGHSRLLTPMPSRSNLTASTTTIARNKSKTVGAKPAMTTAVKRKMGQHPDESRAKRSILKDLRSPNVFVRPKTVVKPTKRVVHKVIATMQNREGKRRSSGKYRMSSGKIVSRGSLPRIRINSENLDSDSTSYECFETYLGDRSPCRSSILEKGPVKKLPTTPSKPSTSKPVSGVEQKSMLGQRTPSPGKKLSTKNLPILI